MGYLTDQFMFYDEAVKIVVDNLHHIQKVILMTNNAIAFEISVAGFNLTTGVNMRSYYQYKALSPLLADKTQANKIHLYQLLKPNSNLSIGNMIYTHAKLYMADDQHVLV